MTKQKYSPSTQAVSDAAEQGLRWWSSNVSPVISDTIAAAALRALVKQNTKEYLVTEQNFERHCEYQTYVDLVCVDDILAIANELES